jgi:hypothetical protein
VAAALEALPLRGPIHKALHVVTILPGQVKKFPGGHVGGLFSEESLKAPTDVRTLPRFEAITASSVPVILNCLEHFLRNGQIRPALFVKTLVFGRRRGEMVVHDHPSGAALFPNARIPEVHCCSLTVL